MPTNYYPVNIHSRSTARQMQRLQKENDLLLGLLFRANTELERRDETTEFLKQWRQIWKP